MGGMRLDGVESLVLRLMKGCSGCLMFNTAVYDRFGFGWDWVRHDLGWAMIVLLDGAFCDVPEAVCVYSSFMETNSVC